MPINISVPFERLADDIEQEVDRKYRGFLLTLFSNLILLSPVAVVNGGRYKSNHIVSIGSPNYAYSESFGSFGGNTPIHNIPQGQFPVAYFQNNLPYALRIENGWSRQAATGVYQNALNSALASFS